MTFKKTLIAVTVAFCLALAVYCVLRITPRSQTSPVPGEIGTNRFYSASGKWMRVSNTNCLVWDSFPREGESVTWSGGVVDGKAEGIGVVQWFTNGTPTSSYEGEMKGGLGEGPGSMKNQFAAFAGEFKHGSLVSRTITIRYPTGGWYKGECKNGFKEGEGEEMMVGGDYLGHFKHDLFDGAGALLLPNGDKITGDWKDSKLAGVGTYAPSNGVSFKVKMTGKGIERF